MAQDELHEKLEEIAEACELNGVFEDATIQRRISIETDPEWSTPKYLHISTILKAFVVGVLSADQWYHGYTLPDGFESVVNWISYNIQKQWPNDVVPQVSIVQLEQLFREWAMQHPTFRKWNETKPGAPMVAVSCRYTPTPDERDFIDLDAVFQNASIYIRDDIRIFEAFNKKFDEEYGKLDTKDF